MTLYATIKSLRDPSVEILDSSKYFFIQHVNRGNKLKVKLSLSVQKETWKTWSLSCAHFQKRNKTTVTELHMGQYNAYTYNQGHEKESSEGPQ